MENSENKKTPEELADEALDKVAGGDSWIIFIFHATDVPSVTRPLNISRLITATAVRAR